MNGHNVQDIQKAQQLYIQLINQGSLIQQTKARSLLNRLQTETSQQQEYHNVEPMQPVPEQNTVVIKCSTSTKRSTNTKCPT